MARTAWPLLAALLLVLPGTGRAADIPVGNWKVTFTDQEQRQQTFWIIKLERKDGKWTGSVVARAEGVPESKLEDVNVAGDRVAFTVQVGGQSLNFEGRPAADGKKVLGSINLGRRLFPVQLDPTTTETLDSYEANKEILAGPPTDPRIFQAALELMARAGERKAKPEEVRGWADKVFRAAEPYGPRWQREVALRTAELLLDHEGMAAIAVEHARRAERMLEPTDKPGIQLRTLNTLARTLRRAGKTDEAKEAEARAAKVDISVRPEKFAGRKAIGGRTVLVELFTGAECPPCVAADLAFDALGKTYAPADVVLLQYHVHIPGPDPLTNPATLARLRYYGDDVEGTPTTLFNGKPSAEGGGSYDDAPAKYRQYRGIIEPLLEQPAAVKLKAGAVQKGNQIDITAEVSDLERPAETVRLRLALVEEQVNYAGGNGIKVHHHVVRAFPGGVEGLVIKEKNIRHTASVDLEELRKELRKYLDDAAKEHGFPNAERPLDLKNLRVVAFIQNDQTKEVLQAVQVEVRGQ
ncbi:MAG TPA: hypothetical protein VNK04_04970 [Gemmataceae bacterium]|nr:hypothetical protein [Gemmataceae bacterium]